jgi:hypothetical protein
LFFLLVLAMGPEYRENTTTEFRVLEHTPAVWVKLPQHALYILQQQNSVQTSRQSNGQEQAK